MTYREHYEAHLEDLTMCGGTVDEMDAVIAEVNALGNANYRPSQLYETWLKETKPLKCTDCGDSFQPALTVNFNSDALCERCEKRKADASSDE